MSNTEYLKDARTPFEIRANMLVLAQEYLQKQWEVQNEFARAAFMEALKQGMANQQDFEKFVPRYFDFSDIVNKARELYGFVSTKA